MTSSVTKRIWGRSILRARGRDSRKNPPNPPTLAVEPLEPRVLLSAGFPLAVVNYPPPSYDNQCEIVCDGGIIVDVNESNLLAEEPLAILTLKKDAGQDELSTDWDLEFQPGDIEPVIVLSATEEDGWSGGDDTLPNDTPVESVEATYLSTPLAFESNQGQTDAAVDFLARGSGYSVFLTESGAVLHFSGEDTSHVVRLDLVGANPAPDATGLDVLAGRSNYFLGNDPQQWYTDIASYRSVEYTDFYDGVSLRYCGNQRQLEYDFIVAAGADSGVISLAFQGAEAMHIAADGNLVLELTSEGDHIRFNVPIVHQDVGGQRRVVASRYVIDEDGTVSFEVGEHDASRHLIVGNGNGKSSISLAGGVAGEPVRRELVFVDSGAEGYQQLIDDLLARRDNGRRIDVIVLDSDHSGIEQISQVLAEGQNLDAIHFVSHGTNQAVKLGNIWLNLGNLEANADAIGGWSDALADGADLLFYGCNLAGGSEGRALIETQVTFSADIQENWSGLLTWYDSNWQYRKQITIDSTKVTGDLTAFPVLVSLASDADLSANARADGFDILFTDDNGATKLDHEIETYVAATGQIVAWVEITSLPSSVDKDIYMYYGNASASDQQNAPGVWDTDYKAVWHMDESSGTTISDSTSNANDGTKRSTAEPNPAPSGQIGGAQDFDGANDEVTNGTLTASLSLTFEAWIRPDAAPGYNTVIEFGDDKPWFGVQSDRTLGFYRGNEGIVSLDKVSLSEFSHIVTTHDGSTLRMYINGVEDLPPGTLNKSDAATRFGVGYNGTDTPFDGIIDEVRISSAVRSSDWITTEYNNQSDPLNFYTLGAAESAPNEAPTINDQSLGPIDENLTNGTVVGTVVASDPNAGDSLTFSITGGNTGNAFAIDSATGEITVNDQTALDYETNPTFSLTVQVTDDGTLSLSDSATVTINLNDFNEAPVINNQSFSVDENASNGTSVGTVVASDVDASDSLSYSITGGNTGGAFAINSSTGEITVANSAALDFETKPSFNLTIQVEDTGSLSDTATVTINLKDVNERYVVIDPPGSNPLVPDTPVEDQQADGDGLDEPTDVTISDPDLPDIRPTPPRLVRSLRSRLLTPLHGIEMHLTVLIGARLTGSYDIWNVFDIRSIHRPGDSHSDAKDVSVSMALIDLSGIDRAAEASQFSIGGSDERLWQELA